ncbi:hypothetical protein, partial [Paraclostridium benzoelyticum]|uniref:hypothetical protein n=1 Tax=Paraclostridium benzoelyticum TaxID=1629550 RepID=UPI001A9A5DAC
MLTIAIPLMSTVLYITVNVFCYNMLAFLTGVNIYKLENYIYLICYYTITYIIIVMVSRFLNNTFINNI